MRKAWELHGFEITRKKREDASVTRRQRSASTVRPSRRNEALDRDLPGAAAGLPEIAGHLHPQPSLRRRAERLRQPDRHLDRDTRAPVQQLRQCLARDAQAFGRPRNRQSQGFEALPPHNAARMRRVVHRHDPSSHSRSWATHAGSPSVSTHRCAIRHRTPPGPSGHTKLRRAQPLLHPSQNRAHRWRSTAGRRVRIPVGRDRPARRG